MILYVVTLSDTFPSKRVALTYLRTVVFENVLCKERSEGEGGRDVTDEDKKEISNV